MNYAWRFPILDGGKKQGINDSGIATFAGSELYNNLAREICQNSLDAKDPEIDEPVVVTFNLKTIYKPAFNPIKGLTEALKSCKDYWSSFEDHKLESFLTEAFGTLESETIDILVASDFNTNGLNGSKTKSGSWDALTGSNGVSYKVNGSQGSYGIGKNAPYACSSLRTVFYNTFSKKDKVKAFQGVTSLVTHLNDNGEETQGCGFYYNIDERKPIFDVENTPDLSIFSRDEFGTDIIILGFKKNVNWKNDIRTAIIKNFFISILNSKLIVRIDQEEINKDTVISILNNSIITSNDDDLKRIKKYVDTYLNPTKVFVSNILSSNDVKLYVKVSDDYDRSIAHFRSSGMLIFEKKIKKMKPYEAVLVVSDGKFNELLKLTEPPKHDKWDYKLLDDLERDKGRKAIQKLNKFILDSIETLCKLDDCDEIDPDGLSDFLPDDVGDNKKKSNKDNSSFNGDISEVTNIKKVDNVVSNEIESATQDVGETNDGEVHNDTDGSDYDETHTNPGSPDDDGSNIATNDDDGVKTIATDLKTNLRLIPVDYEKGEYLLICSFKKAYSKAVIEFNAVGEDGAKDNIFVLKYKTNEELHDVNKNYLELNDVEPSISYKIKVYLVARTRLVIVVGGVGYETK